MAVARTLARFEGQPVTVKDQVNIRLGDTEKKMLSALQNRTGLSQAGIIGLLIRNECVRLKQVEDWEWAKHIHRLGGR